MGTGRIVNYYLGWQGTYFRYFKNLGNLFNIFNFKAFSSVPKVQVTLKHGIPNQKQDAMSVWIDSVTTSQFEVCLQESRTFDGPHSNLAVVSHVWFLYIITIFHLSLFCQ